MDIALGICIGIGLAASCGFRVFVPLLVISAASHAELLTLSDGFSWVGTWPSIMAFAVATILEISAYYVPWLDNLLDTTSGPAAVLAGTIAAAACVADMHPLLQWSVAIIAGGGSAAAVKTGTTGLRAAATVTTAGTGNFVVSTAEWIAALGLSLLSIVWPIVAAIVVLLLIVVMGRLLLWWRGVRR